MEISSYITFKGNCRDAIEFYKKALEAEELSRQTFGESPMASMGLADNIVHCSLKIGGSTLMMSDDPRPGAPSTDGNISLAIGLNDPVRAKLLFENLADGGVIGMPLQKTYWAEAFGMVTDKFGVKWMVNSQAESN